MFEGRRGKAFQRDIDKGIEATLNAFSIAALDPNFRPPISVAIGVGAGVAAHIAVMPDTRPSRQSRQSNEALFRRELERNGLDVQAIDFPALVRSVALLTLPLVVMDSDVYGNVAPLLGHVAGVGEGSGYPALVDEVGAAFNRSDAVAMLKEVESSGQVPDFDIKGGFIELSRILFREVCVAMSCPGVQDEQDSQAMLMWVIMNTDLKTVLQRVDQKQIESLRPSF
jgi:hypothetical protein